MIRSLFLGWMLFAGPLTAAPGAAKQAPVVICLGDSLTEGYEINPDKAFPSLLDRKLKEKFGPEAAVINAGISGATSASGEERLKFQLKAARRPTHLVLALGANDGLRGLPVSAMQKNLESAVKVAKSSNMKVLLAGMKVPPNYGPAYAKAFESTYKKLAREQKIYLIPFLLEGVAAKPELNLPDGIHPNPDGHKIIAETVWKHLEPLL